MLNVIMYNVDYFEKFNLDGHAIMASIKAKISRKMKEKFESTLIKRNGKEVMLLIDKKKEQTKLNLVNNMMKKDFNDLFIDIKQKAQSANEKLCDDTDFELRKRVIAN